MINFFKKRAAKTVQLTYIKTVGNNNTLYGAAPDASKPFKLISQPADKIETSEPGKRFVSAREIKGATITATKPQPIGKAKSQFTLSVDGAKTYYDVDQPADVTIAVLKDSRLIKT